MAGTTSPGAFAVVRYNADGSLDSSFNDDGIVTTAVGSVRGGDAAYSITIQADGKILVAGSCDNGGASYDFALVRYNTDGSLDSSFSSDGIVTTNFSDVGYSVTTQADGKILVAGFSNNGSDFAVARYNTDGSLDTAFGSGGTVTTAIGPSNDFALSVIVQSDGKILVAGYSYFLGGNEYDFSLVRYNSDGSLDSTFDQIGLLNGAPNYIEDETAVVLDSSVVVNDIELSAQGNYAGASITLLRHNGANAEDLYSASGGFSAFTEGSALVLNSNIIGSVTQNSNGILKISFNSNAFQAIVNKTLSSIAYSNSSDNPQASVQIDWIFNDGNTGSQGAGGPQSVNGSTTVNITAMNDASTGTVTITGTATQGQVLTASNSLADIDGLGNISYTWFASGSNIAIGTGTNFTLTQAEVGKTITVTASYIDGQGTTETKTSATSIAVTNINDTPTGNVTISGPVVEGQILTAGNILADADGLGNIAYTWFANGTTQIGLGSTYTLTQAEIDKTITVTASYTDGYNTAESKTSSSTSIVVAAIPYNLIGTPNVDTLTGGLLSDTLTGIGSTDILNGGEDSDLYIMTLASDHSAAEINDTGINGTDEVRFTSTIVSTLNLYAGDKGIEKVAIGTGSSAIADSSGTTALNINAAALTNAISIIGNSGANTLTGTGFHDILDGGLGVDSLIGGTGDDTYLVDLTVAGALQDTVTEAAVTGIDTIRLRGSSTNAAAVALTLGLNIEHLDASATGSSKLNLTGNTLANTLTGNAFDNILDGGTVADSLIGGAGNDTYLVDNALDVVTEALDEGVADLVRINIAVAATAANPYVLTSNVENGTLINTVAYSLTGNDLNNILTGNAAANTLTGLGGDDTLNGLGGVDTMVGGVGNDTYIVDNVGDVVSENADEGTDSVQSSSTYTLTANIENLTLTGAVAINGTGNAGNNTLTGNAAANILNGNGGIDTLIGGDGADTYVVDSADDTVTESNALAAGGIDLVQSSVDWALGANLENLTLTGTGNINGSGNGLNNTITGNTGNNILDGGAGNDTLIAGVGNDLLDGGLGNDTMTGGAGDDQYIVDSATDIVNELALGGNDVINTTLTTFTLGANLEDRIYGGSSNFTGTGNAADNYIQGDLGDDKLNGGAGNDNLTGGFGSDTFIFATALNGATNVDFISDFTAGEDFIQLDRTIFTGVGPDGTLGDSLFANGSIATQADDRIVYDQTSGALYYDADGSGAGAQIQFATLIGLPTVTNADFVIVA